MLTVVEKGADALVIPVQLVNITISQTLCDSYTVMLSTWQVFLCHYQSGAEPDPCPLVSLHILVYMPHMLYTVAMVTTH